MRTRSHIRLTALLLFFTCVSIMAGAQVAPTVERIPLKAGLILTPEFCASRIAHGMAEDEKVGIEIGKVACVELEPALRDVFTSITPISDPKNSGDVQLILTPKFVDAGELMEGLTSFSNYELDIFLQWTATDPSGKTIWLDTVQGSARHHIGNLFTARKNRRLNISDAVKDTAVKSASKMLASVELRKFDQ